MTGFAQVSKESEV